MTQTDIWQELRTQVDLVALIGQRVPLKQQGVRWIGRCPFHADRGRPNLDVAPGRHVWRCWVCGLGGDAVDWVRITENCSTIEAIRQLRDRLGTAPPARPRLLAPYPLADRAIRDVAFRALLTAAGLSSAHRAALLQRGLSPEAVDRAGYATLPPGNRAALVAAMQGAVPDLRGIPGIAYHPRRHQWRLNGAPGLLVPVRDRFGRIQACQIRRDDPSGARYRWLTSAPETPQWTGTSSGTPFHVAGHGWIRPSATWWITEGPLKADVAAAFLQRPVIGIPGVSLWPRVARALAAWRPAAVVLAFDQDVDVETRARVMDAQNQLGALLQDNGLVVYVAHWPDGPKGVDDALTVRAPLDILRCPPVCQTSEAILRAARH